MISWLTEKKLAVQNYSKLINLRTPLFEVISPEDSGGGDVQSVPVFMGCFGLFMLTVFISNYIFI